MISTRVYKLESPLTTSRVSATHILFDNQVWHFALPFLCVFGSSFCFHVCRSVSRWVDSIGYEFRRSEKLLAGRSSPPDSDSFSDAESGENQIS
jgi:hypothetical protein